ncbi:hypothetical protein T06_4582 [Trichinella sp. T6]|nr:hypothetical protein T06_4582 [Trichinella sp. T6]
MRQGFAGPDDVQAVLEAENGQMLMARRTRRKLLHRKWRRWILFLPRFVFFKPPFFPLCMLNAHPLGSFRCDPFA